MPRGASKRAGEKETSIHLAFHIGDQVKPRLNQLRAEWGQEQKSMLERLILRLLESSREIQAYFLAPNDLRVLLVPALRAMADQAERDEQDRLQRPRESRVAEVAGDEQRTSKVTHHSRSSSKQGSQTKAVEPDTRSQTPSPSGQR